MKKINQVVLSYFVIALPIIVIVWLIWPGIEKTETANGSAFFEWGNAITGLMMGLWMLSAFYMALSLVISKNFREQLLKRIAGIKERDEREELIVAKSSRSAFLFSLGLLIFLLVLSVFQINVAKIPADQVVNGKKHELSLGLGFSLTEDARHGTSDSNPSAKEAIFTYRLPVSAQGIILLLIAVQLGSFFVYSRKFGAGHEIKVGD